MGRWSTEEPVFDTLGIGTSSDQRPDLSEEELADLLSRDGWDDAEELSW